jgi:hypothetical protein
MDIGSFIFALVGFIASIGCLVVLPLCVIISGIREKRRSKRELHQNIEEAIDKIMADGKVRRPKGRYKPKKRAGSLIDGITSPPKHSGYYHEPWR